ncbi:Hsp20 family protein [Sphingobium sp. DC-2]|jgi:molecular chaperone IbpA|uniref:Hsp20 family protein n=1 Tax=Sphingobium sp. DC-2 TaxID=1303256 RepID=UPI0004C30A9E|nr:Hsp20 family protein [Sphingobium sp. DC-2]
MRAANYLDLAPYRRSTVGFDRLLDLMNNAAPDAAEPYPPFDIERRADGTYRISVAVPGFRPDELEVVAQQNMLTVSGSKAGGEPQATYLHQGISTRSFERRFPLADFVIVQSAALENGLLTITLKREVPEAMKPRKLDIATTAQPASTTEKDQAQAQA